MKKTGLLLLVATLLLTVCAVSFMGCRLSSMSLDEAKSNLKEAGYEVTVMTAQEYVEAGNDDYFGLETYLYAVKGSDKIYMYFFNTVDNASDSSTFITGGSGLYSGQNNELVYLATKQARKDAKL